MDKEFMKDFHVLPTSKGYVVFHSLSYRFFEVDEDAGKVLSAIEEGRSDISPSAIKKAKDLLLKEVGENAFSLKRNIHGDREGWGGFYLFVSQDCNLKCSYCYGDGGDYRKGRMLMDKATALNFLERFIDGRQKQYGVNLFGGEPLLNFPLIKWLVLAAKEKALRMGFKIDFNITTNGTLWNSEIRDFFKDHISNITVSLDGPKKINDIQRIPRGNFSPHDRAIQTLKELKAIKGQNLTIRTIVTKNSYNMVKDLYRYNSPLAPTGVGITLVDVEPGHPLDISDDELAIMAEDMAKANAEHLTAIMDDMPFLSEQSADLLGLMFFKNYRSKPCNAGRFFLAIAADGEIFPCHRFVGYKEFAMGNVNDTKPMNGNSGQILEELNRLTVDRMQGCRSCWMRHMCGGGCYAVSYVQEGDMAIPWRDYCYLKKRIYHSLLIDFIEIMMEPVKKERFVANAKRLLNNRNSAVC